MTSTIKILLRLLLLGIVLLIATVYYSSNNSGYADNAGRNAELQIIRRRRAIKPATIHYCKVNQYYDQEEGRCLGVPGGGKVLHVENRRSCGVNILKPHCRSSLYYHICKRDKSILAQCASRQIFDNRLQRCVYYDPVTLTPSIILPNDYRYYDHVGVPSCTRSGRFPVPGHCSMFYTCDTNGQRLYQSILKCPQNTGYQVDKGICIVEPSCVNDNSVDSTVCVPDAPGENVESPSLDEATEENAKETSEILEESKASAGDPIVEREENVNSKTYDDIVTTTSVNIIDTLSENNYNDNDSGTDNNTSLLSSEPVKEVSVPDNIDEVMKHSQASNSPENAQKAPDEGQTEEEVESPLGLRITSPSTIELDDAPHSTTISMTLIKPEYHTNADVDSETTDTVPFPTGSYILSKLSKEIQDVTTEMYRNNEDSAVTPPNLNTDSVDLYSAPTVSDVPESSPVSEVSFKVNEKMQDVSTELYRNNEDSAVTPNLNTDSVDLYSAPTVSDVPESSPISDVSSQINEKTQDINTELYRNNEDSTVTPPNLNTDSVDLYSAPTVSDVPKSSPISDVSSKINEKTQDINTELYRNNEDSTVMPPNLNTDSVDLYSAPTVSDVLESSPISEVSSKVNEKMQDVSTELYRNNEDSAVTPPNLNIDSIDLYSAPTVSDVSESSPISDVSSKISEKTQDINTELYRNNEDSTVTPPNLNTDSIDLYSAPTVSDVSESSPISDVSSKISKKTQDINTELYRNNEDSTVTPPNLNTDLVDLYSAPTVGDVLESSPVSEVSSKVNEKIQDVSTELYRNNEDSAVTPPNLNTDSVDLYSAPTVSDVSESSPISDVPSKISEKMQDINTELYRNNEDSTVTPPVLNTDSVDLYSAPTVSDVPESSSVSDVSSKINEETQDVNTELYRNNEDSAVPLRNLNTDSVDLYSAPTVSDVLESSPVSDVLSKIDEKAQDVTTELYRNNEDSIVTPSNLNTDSVDLYSAPTVSNVPESSSVSDVSSKINEDTQDVNTELYRNNEDSTVTSPNLNTDSVNLYSAPTVSDVLESSPISDVLSKIDEKAQDVTTELYRNNEDSIVTPSNLNTDSVDLYSAPTVSDVPESSSVSDVSSKINEETQDVNTELYRNNEDSTVTSPNLNTDSVDLYSAPTVSDIPESSSVSDVSSKINEEMQDVNTELYRNNEDSIVTSPNLNTDSVNLYSAPTVSDIPESSPISDILSKIDEKVQDATTEQYRNNGDSAVTPPNFNTDSVDPYLTRSNIESYPINDTSSKLDEETQNITTEMNREDDRTVILPNSNTEIVDQNPTSALDDNTSIHG